MAEIAPRAPHVGCELVAARLEAGTLVVRAGINRDPDSVMERIQDAVDDGHGAVLSVSCGTPQDGETFIQCLHRVCQVAGFPHPKVQVARYEDVEELGVPLRSDTSEGQAENHYHAWFETPVKRSQVEDFIACFDGPIDNPTGGRKRSNG